MTPSPPSALPYPVMDDFHVTPIGQPKISQPPVLSTSPREARLQREVHRATQTGLGNKLNPGTNRVSVSRFGSRPGRARVLTADRALQMITTIAEKSFGDAISATKSGDRKNFSTSVAIMLDKWTIVSGRPTAIIMLADPERAGVLELARRLAASAGERA